MDIQKYCCPNCNMCFSINTQFNLEKNTIKLDDIYSFELMDVYCFNCKKMIHGIITENAVLWNSEYQMYYNKFVKNKDTYVKKNKKFLYFYFPYDNKEVIGQLFGFVKKELFDSLIIPEYFSDYISWQKQLCVLPSTIFQSNKNSLFPNYLAEKIIINESLKYINSSLYSIYNTFFYNFHSLYNIKNWNKLKLKIN